MDLRFTPEELAFRDEVREFFRTALPEKFRQKMIREQPFDETVLDEAIVFVNTHRQASRIKCATIGWDALSSLLEHDHEKG